MKNLKFYRARAGSFGAVLAMLLTAAACESDNGSSTGEGSSTDVAAAKARIAPLLKTPTDVPLSTPLSKTPPTGKTAYYIMGNIPATQKLEEPFREAVEALGWTAEVIPYAYGNPQEQNSATQQAVDAGADYIWALGSDPNTIGGAAAAARDKGIPIVTWATDAVADPEKNGIYTSIADVEWNVTAAGQLSDWAIADSGGTAHLLFVNFPDASILAATEPRLAAAFKKNCSGCAYDVLNVSTADLTGGNTPGLIVSRLQADPSIDYIQLSFGDLDNGVPEALEAAGITGTRISTVIPDAAGMQYFEDGTLHAILALNEPVSAWQSVDIFARLSVGDEIPARQSPVSQIWTQDNAPDPLPAEIVDPADYADQYREIWKVQ